LTIILRDPHFAEAACFVADLADEDGVCFNPRMPVCNLLGDECELQDFLTSSHGTYVREEDEGDLDVHANTHPNRSRRIVRARRILAPIPSEAVPVVAEATHHYFTAMRSMISGLIADMFDGEHAQDNDDPSEKYDEYDHLNTPACENGRRAQLLAHSTRACRTA